MTISSDDTCRIVSHVIILVILTEKMRVSEKPNILPSDDPNSHEVSRNQSKNESTLKNSSEYLLFITKITRKGQRCEEKTINQQGLSRNS